MGLVGWEKLPGKWVEVGGVHQVITSLGTVAPRCTSAGGGDARFVAIDGDHSHVIIVPWEQWERRIVDLRETKR